MPTCPICTATSQRQLAHTPYWECPNCSLLFQHPLPAKVLHGPHEPPPEAMGDAEKRANEELAKWLADSVLHGKPGSVLDVGSAWPYLAHSFWRLGCSAFGVEPDPAAIAWHEALNVGLYPHDFEAWEPPSGLRFDLVTNVHSFEHVYDPLAAMRKIRTLLADDGRWFIRMPDRHIHGIARDMTPGHWQIHPYVHGLSSILQCCAITGAFVVEWDMPLVPGQRDLVLRPA